MQELVNGDDKEATKRVTPTAGCKRNSSMLNTDKCDALLDRLIAGETLLRRASDHAAMIQALPTECHQNFAWREKVALWFYDVADRLDESRDVVYVAMNMLDRYLTLNRSETLMNTVGYELAAITSLFIAIRVSGSTSLEVQDLLRMSRSDIQGRDIISTGTDMIKSLSWEHKLITPTDFVKSFVSLLQSTSLIDHGTAVSILELASFLVEISVCDQYFIGIPPSKIAYAAMLNVLNNLDSCNLDDTKLSKFLYLVLQDTGMRPDSDEITEIASRLSDVYGQTEESFDRERPHLIMD